MSTLGWLLIAAAFVAFAVLVNNGGPALIATLQQALGGKPEESGITPAGGWSGGGPGGGGGSGGGSGGFQ